MQMNAVPYPHHSIIPRRIVIEEPRDCCGCSACAMACPRQCIALREDREGFLYPHIDNIRCCDCGLCRQVCPAENPRPQTNCIPDVYAAKNRDEAIRKESSSGGIFTLLAEEILSQGGVVFGARVTSDFSVRHDYVEAINGLSAFRGSKYVQSQMSDNYRKAEIFLKGGRQVLFSGTPCQIAGLRRYLRRNYENLLAVDIVCHGVPSPKVLNLYLEELNQDSTGGLTKLQFRNKVEGWRKFSFVTERKVGNNSVTHRETANKNIFMRGFLSNLYLRPSCHACPARNFLSGSDIVLGDFWGIEHFFPEFDDDLGVSLVLAVTPRGKSFFASVANRMFIIPATLDQAQSCNSPLVCSVAPHRKREEFFKRLDTMPISRVIENCIRPPLCRRLLRKLRMALRSLRGCMERLKPGREARY